MGIQCLRAAGGEVLARLSHESRRRADIVIDNDGTLGELAASAEEAWEQILGRLGGAAGADRATESA